MKMAPYPFLVLVFVGGCFLSEPFALEKETAKDDNFLFDA